MKLAMHLAVFLCLASTPSFAGTWSGYLVDSKCYDIEEQNVSPWDTSGYVDRDKNLEIQLCSPNAKTKSFAVVPADWMSIKLNAAGNSKATELVRNIGKKSVIKVTVIGQENKTTVKVDSISIQNK